jgi:LPXTG-motif cell wall-anchored protein
MIVMSEIGALDYDYRTMLASIKFDRQAAINYNMTNRDKFIKGAVATHITDATKDMWVLEILPTGKSISVFQANPSANSSDFANAVALFQKENGLTADGKLGQDTAKKLAAKTGASMINTVPYGSGSKSSTPAKMEEKSSGIVALPWYKRIPWYGYAGAGLLVVGGGFVLLKKKKSGLGNIDNGIHGCGCGKE